MTFYDLLQFTNAIIALILGSFLVWLLSKGFRYKIWKYFFSIWKDILVVSVLVAFIIMFIPFQFKQTVLAMLIVVYIFLFRLWGPNKVERKIALGKSGKIRRFITPKEGWVAMIIIVGIVILLGKGESIIGAGIKVANNSKSLLINNNGDISYDYDNSGNYGVGLSDTDQDGKYDTVKYDINRDGIVDLIHKDTNQDSIIDEVEVLDYKKQRLRVHLFLLLSIIAIGLWGIDRRRLKWQLKDKGVTKEEDLKMTNDKAEEYKELKKKADQKLEDIKSKEIVLDDEKEIDLDVADKKFSKILSGIVIVIFSFTSVFSPAVLALSQSEMMMQMGQYEDCAKNAFDDNQCVGVSPEIRRYMQHIVCSPKFRDESMEWNERMQIASMYSTEEEYKKTVNEYQSWWSRWKGITPRPCMDVANEETENTEETGTELENQDIQIEGNSDEEYENPNKEKEEEKFSWDGEGENFVNTDIKALYDKAKKGGSPDIDYFKMLDDIVKYEKALADSSGKLLEGVNQLNKLENLVTALFKESNLDKKEKVLKKALDTLNKWKGEKIKVDDLFDIMSDDLKKIKRKKLKNFEKYMKRIGVENGKFGKTLKVFDIAGKGMDIYADSRDFHKLLKGDPGKVVVAVTLTTAGKWTLGANPVDVTTGLIGGGLILIGKDKRGGFVSSISAGDIAKKTIEDAFTTTTSDFKNIVNYESQESKKAWKDNQYNIVEKVGIQFNSIATLGYGVGVLGVQKILEFQEPGIKAFSDGVREIGKWLK